MQSNSEKSILEIVHKFSNLFPHITLWHQFSYLSNTHFFKVDNDTLFDKDEFLNFYFTVLPYHESILMEDITFVGTDHLAILDNLALQYDAETHTSKNTERSFQSYAEQLIQWSTNYFFDMKNFIKRR